MDIFCLEKKLKKADKKVRLKILKFIIQMRLLGPQIDFIDSTDAENIKSTDLFLGYSLQIELTGETLITSTDNQTTLEEKA